MINQQVKSDRVGSCNKNFLPRNPTPLGFLRAAADGPQPRPPEEIPRALLSAPPCWGRCTALREPGTARSAPAVGVFTARSNSCPQQLPARLSERRGGRENSATATRVASSARNTERAVGAIVGTSRALSARSPVTADLSCHLEGSTSAHGPAVAGWYAERWHRGLSCLFSITCHGTIAVEGGQRVCTTPSTSSASGSLTVS